MKDKARLEKQYIDEIRPQLQKELGLENIMQIPRLRKIVLNVGVKGAVGDSKELQVVADVVQKISGQRPVRCIARKSIASFKLREGMPIGVKVTLRGRAMYEFLDRLINLALPNYRDFQGVSTKFDNQGNYNLGIKEWSIFPEIEFEVSSKVYGMNITIETSTNDDNQARALLKKFRMPFKSA